MNSLHTIDIMIEKTPFATTSKYSRTLMKNFNKKCANLYKKKN